MTLVKSPEGCINALRKHLYRVGRDAYVPAYLEDCLAEVKYIATKIVASKSANPIDVAMASWGYMCTPLHCQVPPNFVEILFYWLNRIGEVSVRPAEGANAPEGGGQPETTQ
jgi:hypothetical protein